MIGPMTKERPLSPHLQVYRLPMTAKMSITHRMTGVILMAGTLLVAVVLIAAALGEAYYNDVMGWVRSDIGIVLLFGWSLALYYHLFNGIRHLFWDMGYLFELKNARAAGWVVLFATAGMTALTWYYAAGY